MQRTCVNIRMCTVFLVAESRARVLHYVEIIHNSTSVAFDYLLMSWVKNNAHIRGFLICLVSNL